ncbi:FAD-binding protein [Solibacillus sp. FSL H8-0523]|uniref:FAD-binding protein n=1 Tax=Solibacillus sp. FSL H8-0523 TaxID=2954511 RepID=UPI003100CC60
MQKECQMMNNEKFDVIVVGAGMAGVCASLEAAEQGQTVLLIDVAYGGGTSGISGGVVYAGGGTSTQLEAGVEDSIDNMYNYLIQETAGVVKDETVRRFCEESPASIDWLKAKGVKFQGTVCPYKTSYPNDQFYLYYSGNEKSYPYKNHATPAPRGHRTVAKGLDSGKVLMETLLNYAKKQPTITFQPLCKITDLIVEDDAVVGIKYRGVKNFTNEKHTRYSKIGTNYGKYIKPLGEKMDKLSNSIWEESAKDYEAYATGVILSSGGFIFNSEMVKKYGGKADHTMALGTVHDSGYGIQLGQKVGGDVAHMDSLSIWRFLSPPSDFIRGVVVDGNGQRILNEDLYGATFTKKMVDQHDGKGYLFVDREIWEAAKRNGPKESLSFQALMMQYLFKLGHYKANSIAELAKKVKLPEEVVVDTITEYNNAIFLGKDEPMHKTNEAATPLLRPPFYCVNVSIKNSPFNPAPALTLGGLRVNEETGEVLRADGSEISGLYAAGRTAVGICSNSYLSGLSLADGMFSGRRAARHIANVASSVHTVEV